MMRTLPGRDFATEQTKFQQSQLPNLWIHSREKSASEMGVHIPDSSTHVWAQPLDEETGGSRYPDLNFRLSVVRNALLADTVPTSESVTKYSEHLLAELDQMGQHSKRKEAGEAQPKIKKLEEGSKSEERQQRPRWKPQEEFESKRKPCRFFQSDQGCKRSRSCPFGHLMDGERRCWTCGSKDPMATTCPTLEDSKPKASKLSSKVVEKDSKTSGSSAEKSEVPSEAPEHAGEESMKSLPDEASRMLKSMSEGDVKEKRLAKEDPGLKIQSLQKQLDDLKKAAMRPFRISKICSATNKGLLDSGAIHSEPSTRVKICTIFQRSSWRWRGTKRSKCHLLPQEGMRSCLGSKGPECPSPSMGKARCSSWRWMSSFGTWCGHEAHSSDWEQINMCLCGGLGWWFGSLGIDDFVNLEPI